MSELLEIIMIVSFGASRPLNVIKSLKARTAKGKSVGFLLPIILFGYVAGIASKLLNNTYIARFSEKRYVLRFYILSFCMVSVDLCLYIRSRRLDKAAGR